MKDTTAAYEFAQVEDLYGWQIRCVYISMIAAAAILRGAASAK